MILQPIDTAPRDRALLVYAKNTAGDGDYAVAIWFFNDWGTTNPILGDGLGFSPTHWCELPKQPIPSEEADNG